MRRVYPGCGLRRQEPVYPGQLREKPLRTHERLRSAWAAVLRRPLRGVLLGLRLRAGGVTRRQARLLHLVQLCRRRVHEQDRGDLSGDLLPRWRLPARWLLTGAVGANPRPCPFERSPA